MSRLSLRAVAATCALLAVGVAAAPLANADTDPSFKRLSTTPAYLNAGDVTAEAVAEISTVSPDGNTLFYTDAGGGVIGNLDISDPASPRPLGTIDVGGEPTSVFAIEGHVLVVVDTSGSFTAPTGHVSVLDAETFAEVRRIELGGQPDSIDVHGTTAVIAMENQRDEDVLNDLGTGEEGDLPQAPAGELAVIGLDGAVADWTLTKVSLTGLAGLHVAEDPEPEYVKFSPDGSRIAVTLQENNAVVIVDADSLEVLASWSAGEATVEDVDVVEDGQLILDGTVSAPREPDAIGWVDDAHVATANEGDWLGGTRNWTIFDATTGDVVWDAGNTFEYEAIRNGHWIDDRAENKGVEPEGLSVATFGDVRYAFVGSERANFVAVYDVTDPANPIYLQMLPTTNGPEGILPIPERNLLAVSSEEDDPESPVRATVALYELGEGAPLYPQIKSADIGGKPIGWQALGALAGSDEAGILYAITDDALAPNRILTVDATQVPAVITAALDVTKDGQPTAYDVEGLHAIPGGEGFWLGVEGDGETTTNKVVRVDADGVVQEEIELSDELAATLGKWGIEGVTADPAGEFLYVALQRNVTAGEPTRIARYDVAAGEWTSFLYELEPTDTAGDWTGLSEITYVGADAAGVRLAVIERDKLNGPAASIKRIYEVTISPDAADGETLAKTLVHDVLPDLRATNGWTQEKLEGMTIDAAGNVFVVTDNDGLDDNNGETVFLGLGQLFGVLGEASPSATPSAAPTPSASPSQQPRPGLPRTGA